MLYLTNRDGEIQSIKPERLAAVLDAVKPTVISVRAQTGDELTIGDIAVDVRPNGVHILLDVPEAVCAED